MRLVRTPPPNPEIPNKTKQKSKKKITKIIITAQSLHRAEFLFFTRSGNHFLQTRVPYYFKKKREKQSVKTYLILIYTERIIKHLKTKKNYKNPKRVQTHQKKNIVKFHCINQ